MAGPFYVDPAAGGTNDGSSWTNAWTSLQSAFDTAVAGEIVYCRGTQTLGATLDVDTNAGTNAAGWIKIIGCNAAGNVDGTRFVINGNGGAYHGITVAAKAMYWLENIRVTNCGNSTSYYGVNHGTTLGYGWVYINCSFDNNAGHGMYGFRNSYGIYYRCTAYQNGGDGCNLVGTYSFVLFCSSHDNTSSGFYPSFNTYLGCLSYDNGDDGYEGTSLQANLIQCTADGNADDGVVILAGTMDAYTALVLGCRITNHSGAGDIGLNCLSDPVITGWCYFEDNDGDNIQNATLHQFLPVAGSSTTTNIEDQANTNEGYTSLVDGSEDFNLRSDASLRRSAISIPLV